MAKAAPETPQSRKDKEVKDSTGAKFDPQIPIQYVITDQASFDQVLSPATTPLSSLWSSGSYGLAGAISDNELPPVVLLEGFENPGVLSHQLVDYPFDTWRHWTISTFTRRLLNAFSAMLLRKSYPLGR